MALEPQTKKQKLETEEEESQLESHLLEQIDCCQNEVLSLVKTKRHNLLLHSSSSSFLDRRA